MATVELLQNALGNTFADRVYCYGSVSRTLTLREARVVQQRPLCDLSQLQPHPTILLHLAFLTKERAETMDEATYRRANDEIGQTVLDALDPMGVTGIFVASSGAARHADDTTAPHALKLYGLLKRNDESRFKAWAESKRKTAVIARIFNLSGPYINKHQAYALAAFINDALAARTVKVNAPFPVTRSFVAIRELMSLVFSLILEDRQSVISFDTGGVPLELGDVARLVAEILEAGGAERAAITSDEANRYVGDGQSYRKLLVSQGIEAVSMEQQILETADFLSRTS